MWISAQVVLLGAEINAVLEHLSPEGKKVGAKSLADTGADAPKSVKEARGEAVLPHAGNQGKAVVRDRRPAPLARAVPEAKEKVATLAAAAGVAFLFGAKLARR